MLEVRKDVKITGDDKVLKLKAKSGFSIVLPLHMARDLFIISKDKKLN